MPPPPPLSQRPQATAFSIEDLLDRVRRGGVRVPEFQRPLRWKADDLRDLLDSIYRGYPIGTLLFWKREAPAAVLHFGPVKIDAPQTAQALWAVDGQQRITALAGVLLHPPLEGDATQDDFALYFDLEQEEFVRLPRRTTPLSHWLPMNVVLDSEQLLGWLDRHASRIENPAHTRAAMKLGKVLREYQVPAYIVETDDLDVLRVIYERLNSAGAPLSWAEVFDAIHGPQNPEQLANLLALSESLRELGFGAIEKQWLLKAVLAIRGLDLSQDTHQQLQDEPHLPELLKQTEQALRAAIVFLKRDAGIPHILLVPSKLQLVLLARFFHLHPEPSARSRELLARWLWRCISNLYFGSITTAGVRRSLGSISTNEEQTLQQLLAPLRPAGEQRLPSRPFNFGTARTKVEVNALLSFQPRHLIDGQLLDVATLLEAEGTAALTRVINQWQFPTGHPPDTLGNRIVHRPMGQMIGLFLQRALKEAPQIVQSHAIPPSAAAAFRRGDALGFMKERDDFLSGYLPQFLGSRARWEASDHGSLQSMIVSDEED